jgi:hypothetical protein
MFADIIFKTAHITAERTLTRFRIVDPVAAVGTQVGTPLVLFPHGLLFYRISFNPGQRCVFVGKLGRGRRGHFKFRSGYITAIRAAVIARIQLVSAVGTAAAGISLPFFG